MLIARSLTLILLTLVFDLSFGFAHSNPTENKPAHRVLIFWGSLGQGHKSAAEGIARDLKKLNPEAEILTRDVREFMTPYMKRWTAEMYDFSTKVTPGMYDTWFRYYMRRGKHVESVTDIGLYSEFSLPRLQQYINEFNPSLIISTFNHATEAMIELRDMGQIATVPIAWQHTDYVDEAYFAQLSSEIDMSFLPHEFLQKSWIRRGVPVSKIMTTGMPLNPEVFVPQSKRQRNEFLRTNGLDPNITTIALISGSAGVGNFKNMVRSMAAAFKTPVQIVAMCGTSDLNFKRLESYKSKLPSNVTLKIHRKLDQHVVFEYFKASDVVVTKTGGLTPTEVLAIGKPAVFLDVNGGQERYNADFFESQGLAIINRNIYRLGADVAQVAYNKHFVADNMMLKQAKFRETLLPHNQERIAHWALEASAATLAKRGQNETPKAPPRLSDMVVKKARFFTSCLRALIDP